ncbi:hypothetical protein FVA74_12935 [Salinibacterium sp. dk2585]|uniref:hypothetical protein n=1 Tax=unclassified Salinibacterium TaxID=2632331 RepID=UPI0011C25323|nr:MULTISPECIES: hypothetical protein [unclassified Salinibacterium]QEE62378.1 hypothetical protein FVA74_12935 [Salinibacterium sp. dk2585]TXK52739.1 hypothetical protein FVP63_12460 [Salinibacterium sp. dk5596]
MAGPWAPRRWPVIRPERGLAACLSITVAACLVLLAARRWPGPVLVFVTAAAVADLLLRPETSGPPFVALAFAIVGAIARNARVWAWVSAGVMWVTVLLASLALELAPSRVAFSTLGAVSRCCVPGEKG